MSEPSNPKRFRLLQGDGFGFENGQRVPVATQDVKSSGTAREDLENELLDEGLPFEVASRAGELFERAVTAAATKKAADTLKSFLQLLQSTKLGRTAQFIALKKLISPDMTYESLCAGTKHTKQKVHYHVTQFRQNFYRKPIGED